MAKDNSQVEVAKITSRQAVLVAIISAIAGIVGTVGATYAKRSDSPHEKTIQRYLTITSVDGPKGSLARIVADINGQTYSFPSRALVSAIGHELPSEAFPLPIDQSEFVIRFSAFCGNSLDELREYTNEIKHRLSNEQLSVEPLPIAKDYPLHLIQGNTRFPEPEAVTVHYEIR